MKCLDRKIKLLMAYIYSYSQSSIKQYTISIMEKGDYIQAMVSIVVFLSKASHGTFARLGSTSSIWAVIASMTSRCQCNKTIMFLILIKHVTD